MILKQVYMHMHKYVREREKNKRATDNLLSFNKPPHALFVIMLFTIPDSKSIQHCKLLDEKRKKKTKKNEEFIQI